MFRKIYTRSLPIVYRNRYNSYHLIKRFTEYSKDNLNIEQVKELQKQNKQDEFERKDKLIAITCIISLNIVTFLSAVFFPGIL